MVGKLKFNTPVDDRSAIFWDGQEYGHFFWMDDCSAILGMDNCSAIFWGVDDRSAIFWGRMTARPFFGMDKSTAIFWGGRLGG